MRLLQHWRSAYRVALRLLGDAFEAEDVAQEVLLQLHLAGVLPTEAEERAWVYAVTVNRCRDLQRSHRVRRTAPALPPALEVAAPGPSPEHALERAQRGARLRHAIGQLSPEHRNALVVHDLEEQPYHQARLSLGVSESALKSRVIRARRALAALLRGELDAA